MPGDGGSYLTLLDASSVPTSAEVSLPDVPAVLALE